MNGLYYQYGSGPQSMMGPDYQTFLQLLEEMRKAGSAGGQSSGGQQGGLSSLFKMFGGSNAGPSAGDMAGAAGPMVDTPIGGAGGITGLFA